MGRIETKFKQTEVGLVPWDWEVKELKDIGECVIGLTYSPSNVRSYGTLVLRSSNVQNGRLSFDDNVFVDMDLPQRVIVKESDILICARNGSKHLIGKCALINKKTSGSAFGAFMSVYRGEFPKLVFHQFRSDIIQKQIEETLGATINQITNKDLRSFRVVIPTNKTEQTAIANALSDVDGYIESLEKLIDKKQKIKQGAMQQLLKPQTHWEVKKLGEIANFYKGRGLSKSEIKESGKFKCIHYGELFTKYGHRIFNIISYTDKKEDSFHSSVNDVLMPTSDVTPNGLATASCIMENGVIIGGDVLVIRLNSNTMNGVFLSYFIDKNREEVMKLVSGSTVYHLYGSDIKKLSITYPSIEEQERITNALSDMELELNTLNQKLTKAKDLKQGMMQQLLTGKIRLL